MKYSKQRELILTYIQNSTNHPTADMVYKKVQMAIPNISLGTVYRNLNQLCEMNLIRKIVVPNKVDRFDKVYNDHGHLYCARCSKVEDISQNMLMEACNMIASKTSYKIISHDMVFVGICNDCLEGKDG